MSSARNDLPVAALAAWLWNVSVRLTAAAPVPLVSVIEYCCAGVPSPEVEIDVVQLPLAVVLTSDEPMRILLLSVLPKSKPLARSMKPPVNFAGVELTLLV